MWRCVIFLVRVVHCARNEETKKKHRGGNLAGFFVGEIRPLQERSGLRLCRLRYRTKSLSIFWFCTSQDHSTSPGKSASCASWSMPEYFWNAPFSWLTCSKNAPKQSIYRHTLSFFHFFSWGIGRPTSATGRASTLCFSSRMVTTGVTRLRSARCLSAVLRLFGVLLQSMVSPEASSNAWAVADLNS